MPVDHTRRPGPAENEATAMHEPIDRRQLLGRGLAWTAAGAAIGTATSTGVALGATPAGASVRRTAVWDVACLLHTFTPILAAGATDPPSNFRGTTFFVEGELYPGGAIPAGVTDFDPGSVTPLGHWFCRGWFINRTGRPGEPDRPEPHVITHQEYLIGRITPDALYPADQLTSSGTEGGPGVAVRSVVGGTGAYLGATGEVLQHTIGQNTTGGPNFRFEFRLVKHGR